VNAPNILSNIFMPRRPRPHTRRPPQRSSPQRIAGTSRLGPTWIIEQVQSESSSASDLERYHQQERLQTIPNYYEHNSAEEYTQDVSTSEDEHDLDAPRFAQWAEDDLVEGKAEKSASSSVTHAEDLVRCGSRLSLPKLIM
jgi:hypothetical protein